MRFANQTIVMRKNFLSVTALTLLGLSAFAQNVGIGTNNPQTKLQVEGAISSTPASAAAAATVTIPDNTSVFRLTATGGAQANALGMAAPHEGQYLSIYNTDDDVATFAGQTIAASTGVASFNYINGGWRTVSNTKAGGDLSGTYPNPLVVKIQGKAVSATAPNNGDVLKYNTTTSQYEPSPDLNSGGTVGSVTASSPLSSTGGSSPNISLTGTVPVGNGGTGLTAVGPGQILIGTSSNTFLNTTLTGTANQVNINSASGAVTLSTPQDIATTSSPTFNKVTATGANINSIDATGSIKPGTTTATAATAGAGAIRTNGTNLEYSDGTTWKALSTGGTVTNVTGTAPIVSSGGNTPTISLATTGTAGTYTKVTTDAYGRVTNGTNLSTGDIPNLSGTYVDLSTNQTAAGNKTWSGVGNFTGAGTGLNVTNTGAFGSSVAVGPKGSFFGADQGGNIELGTDNGTANTAGAVPYIDFHYGTGAAQDFNVRLQNDANGQLAIIGNARISGLTTAGFVTNNASGQLSTTTSIANSATTATSSNTPNTIVLRDGSGNFSAGTISANLNGKANLWGYYDNRTLSPNSYNHNAAAFGFTSFNNNNTAPWADFMQLNSYGDASGGNDNLLVFNRSSIGMRIYQQTWNSATAFSAYKDVAFTQDIATGYIQNTTTQQTSSNFNISNNGIVGGSLMVGSNATPPFPLTVRTATGTANTTVASLANAIGDGNFQLNVTRGSTVNASGEVSTAIGQAYNGGGLSEAMRFHRGGGATDGAISFLTNSAERIRITSAGNVGIGVTNPTYKLEIANGASFGYGNGTDGSYKSRTETRDDAGQQGSQSGFFETSTPSPSGDWYPGANSWQHLLDIRHSNNSNNYAMQFAGSFYDQRLFFRKTNNSASAAWSEVLTVPTGNTAAVNNSAWALNATLVSSRDDLSGGDITAFDNCDDCVQTQNLGFTVRIDGTDYTQVSICTNGWIAFGSTSSTSCCNAGWPLSFITNPIIAPYYHDMKDYGSGEYIRTYTVGSAPSRTFIVWEKMRELNSSNRSIEYMVMIHETSGLINVKYFGSDATLNGQAGNNNTVIGFQLSGGSSAKYYPITYNGKILDDNNQFDSWSVSPVR